MKEQIEADFQEIHTRMRQLEQTYNPQKQNLHFVPLDKADVNLYVALIQLAREGLAKVHQHRDYFLKHRLYSDGMFWYNLFLLIKAAGKRVNTDKGQNVITPELVNNLTEVLVEVSEYAVKYGDIDIKQRNYEALGNTLWAFYRDDLVTLARRKGREVGAQQVRQFVNETISKVKKIRNNESR